MERAKRVLVVDDEEQNRLLVSALVRGLGYEAETARDGMDALSKLALDFDLVLLDVRMPRMDGFEVLRRVRQDPRTRELPVVMLTSIAGRADRQRAIDAGASDFIAKPADRTELKVRLQAQLELAEARQALELQASSLEEQVEQRTALLRESLESMAQAQRDTYDAQLDTIRRLVLAAEFKDADTAHHVVRLGIYSGILARALHFSPQEEEVLRHAISMHDVGKIGIPDAILTKPGRLTAAERLVMETHTVIGARILSGSPSELLREGEVIALAHHERWDGGGYPRRLAGEQIPLGARICTVVDVFDALTTRRPYRQPLAPGGALAEMQRDRGSHFDPTLFDLFLADRDRVIALCASFGNGADGPAERTSR
jgi:putative two-component system response regulator